MTTRRGLLGLGVVVAVLATAGVAAAAPAGGEIREVAGATVVPDSYVVVLKRGSVRSDAVAGKAGDLARHFGGKPGRTYQHAVRGFEVTMGEAAARRLARDPSVSYVQRNGVYSVDGTQTPTPSWGLDRIDQRPLPLNGAYTFPNTGSLVKAYIIDTGIRFSHVDFGGRAVSGYDSIDGGLADDLNGHGTHVAGTVGGASYGVAKNVILVGVRVLDMFGFGTTATVLAGVDWVTGNHRPGEPAVANMSLGGGLDPALDAGIATSIASGITYGVAAGNDSGADACNTSPARLPAAITVGASTITDARASFSNIGRCLDLFAPGGSITSDWNTGDTATAVVSGTSMAAPHVVGAAALVLRSHPTYTPQQVRDSLVDTATVGVITSPGVGSPNRLLFVVNTPPAANDFRLSTVPGSGTVIQGTAATTTVTTAVTAGATRPIALTASGLPSGATATFTPAALNTGASSLLRIATTPSTPIGTYEITIAGTGTSPTVVRTTTYVLTVIGPPGCFGSNPADVPIRDLTIVESTVTITGCPGLAGSGSAVTVSIVHTFIGDLVVMLVAPDGSVYTLHARTGGATDNLVRTYTVNLSAEGANGTWRLRVADLAGGDIGFINAWSIGLRGTAGPCVGTNQTDVAIPDIGIATSAITLPTCAGQGSPTSMVDVHIVHPQIGNLIVTLLAPDGTPYVLHAGTGGTTDNIDRTYPVDLSSEARAGTWRLRVTDTATPYTGRIDAWTISL